MKMGRSGCLLAIIAIAGATLVSGSTADVAFYDEGYQCEDHPLHTLHNITTDTCQSFSGLGIYVKCEYAGSWTAYIFQNYQSCIYGTNTPQYVDSDVFFHGDSKDDCAAGHHGSSSFSSPTYQIKVACRYNQHQSDGHIAFQVYSNPGLHVGCNNKPIAETMYIKNGDCVTDLYNSISFNVTCEQVNDAFSSWKLKIYNSSKCDSNHLPYDIVGNSPNCTSFEDPQHYLNSVIHAKVYCDRATIPHEFFNINWRTFEYKHDDPTNTTCSYNHDDYSVTGDNGYNGQCITGLTWKVKDKSEKTVSARVSCSGNYKGSPWYMIVYESSECEQGPEIDAVYSQMDSTIACRTAQESNFMNVQVDCGGPIQTYISWKGYNETFNDEQNCEGEPALIDDSYLTGDCSIHYFGTQSKLYGFQAICLYREDGWVMNIWNNTRCAGEPFGMIHYPMFGETPEKPTGLGGVGCSSGRFKEYIADIQVFVNCTGPVTYPGHDLKGAISWDIWYEQEPDAEKLPCKSHSADISVGNYTNAKCYNGKTPDNNPYSTLVYCRDNSRYSLWTLEYWYNSSDCHGIPSGIIQGYDATCSESISDPGFQAVVRCNGPKEPEHIVFNWQLWINSSECSGEPTVRQDIYNNTECYLVYVKEDDKNMTYGHEVFCESNEKDSPWIMNIYEGDTCAGVPVDTIRSSDKNETCSASTGKYHTSASVDCTGKGKWDISWQLWVDEPDADTNDTQHCRGPHLSNYFYEANSCQKLNFTRIYDHFSAQSYQINCVSHSQDSGYTVIFYDDPYCFTHPAHLLYYDGKGDPSCVSSHYGSPLHVSVNCSTESPSTFGVDSIVEFKYGAKLPESSKNEADICGLTATIAEGSVQTGVCHTDLGFHNAYSIRVYCEDVSEKSRWSLLLYDGIYCKGNPVAAFEGGSDHGQCGFNLLGDTVNIAEVVCKPHKNGSKSGLKKGAKIGLIITGIIIGLILLVLAAIYGMKSWRQRKERYDSETVYRPLTTPIAEMPMGSKS